MRSLGLLLLRIVVGGTMMAHGFPKLFGGPDKEPPEKALKVLGPNWEGFFKGSGPKNFAGYLEQLELPYPQVGAYASGIAEFFGGLGLLLGFKSRLAALAIIGNLSVAIWKVHWKNGYFGQGGFELPLSLATGAATVALAGPGNLSVDALTSCCCKCKEEKEPD